MKLRNLAPNLRHVHRSLMRDPFHVLFRLDCSRKCWQEVCHQGLARRTEGEVNASGARTCIAAGSCCLINGLNDGLKCPVGAGNGAVPRREGSAICVSSVALLVSDGAAE